MVAPLLGIDVSPWQMPPYTAHAIDWPRVRAAGVRFAWIKATEMGASKRYRYESFHTNFPRALGADIFAGAYAFVRWERGAPSGDAQARYLHEWIGEVDAGEIPIAMDLEWIKGQRNTAVDIAKCGLDFLEAAHELSGRRPCVYVGAGFWRWCVRPAGALTERFLDYPLWQVDYQDPLDALLGASIIGFPPRQWRPIARQYTSEGVVDGVDGHVDLSHFFGTEDDLVAFAGGRAPVAP